MSAPSTHSPLVGSLHSPSNHSADASVSGKATAYEAHTPDHDGKIHWSETEHRTWQTLMERQLALIEGRVCRQYLEGLERLALPTDHIPQLDAIDRVLDDATGWRTAAVPALIPFDTFFELLANRRFPVATFIRTPEELDYLKEPDIFHEIFGHCPMLTNPAFAEFTATYGRLGLAAEPKDRVYLARLYWMTVEFGLVDTPEGRRIYGGGIISSPRETLHALSDAPVTHRFDALEALRTPYRIDILQPLYYVLDSLDDLQTLAQQDLMALVEQAKALGLFAPLFTPKARTPRA
ncbi:MULTISPECIES: phenylalanine 4-monooxygenase [unclassified Halomonas]|uniref:phenylalanine 4-monooxygenase n=1 Tax=unclassified Halomonas TaxID=2609666 RepID=UPI001C945AC6|nr:MULTISPECIES: phenylalanine 4-monooxygenase [unclassified Halomonas]MBY5926960.1 phenylalanine 4-monooxygenase [Halomonas sp. DP4Y7-2]MBY6234002.1 phenylalanine 4-monooxygenase [Halomonas sp. DP4Y7-1]